MISKLLLFGATGDLSGRFLLPALAKLSVEGLLPEDFELLGCATEDLDDDAFRRRASDRLGEHAAQLPPAARGALIRQLHYRRVDLEDPRSVAGVVAASSAGGSRSIVAYLALPGRVVPGAVTTLASVGLPEHSRLVVEKPFGDDLDSAKALNQRLTRVAGGEHAIFRVDHALGMASVQNVLGLRLGNRILEDAWSSEHIDQIDLLWEETLALEGRAGYFDHAGTLKDVVQNHVFQLLCFVGMDLPEDLDERQLRDRKVGLLRSVRRLSPSEVATRTRRARYTAGRLARNGRAVPSYVDEPGVDPARQTETYCELNLELDSPRWKGTRFVIRAGKALRHRQKKIVVWFRPSSHAQLPGARGGSALHLGIDGPEDLRLQLTGQAPMTLKSQPIPSALPAYGNVLLDILNGGSTLSIRGDEAEEAWRVLDPVLHAWAEGEVPLEEYRAGSSGPTAAGRAPASEPEPQHAGG